MRFREIREIKNERITDRCAYNKDTFDVDKRIVVNPNKKDTTPFQDKKYYDPDRRIIVK
jgi:hypothetical protein